MRYAGPPRWENGYKLAKWKLTEAGILSVEPPMGSHLDILELGRWVTTDSPHSAFGSTLQKMAGFFASGKVH